MLDIQDLIGVPYKVRGRYIDGADCFGLVEIYYRAFMDAELPEAIGHYSDSVNAREVSAFIELNTPSYLRVHYSERKSGDIIMFKILGLPTHVGIVIDKNRMLHTLSGRESVMERYTGLSWRNRIEGIYRVK